MKYQYILLLPILVLLTGCGKTNPQEELNAKMNECFSKLEEPVSVNIGDKTKDCVSKILYDAEEGEERYC